MAATEHEGALQAKVKISVSFEQCAPKHKGVFPSSSNQTPKTFIPPQMVGKDNPSDSKGISYQPHGNGLRIRLKIQEGNIPCTIELMEKILIFPGSVFTVTTFKHSSEVNSRSWYFSFTNQRNPKGNWRQTSQDKMVNNLPFLEAKPVSFTLFT